MQVLRFLFQVYFWIFNGILLLIAYLGFIPFFAWQFSQDPSAGLLPIDFMLPFLGLVAAPTTAAYFTIKRPKTPFPSVFRIFYGIEMPLIFLLSFRFFILHQLTLATSFLILTAVLGMAAFGFRNFWRDRPTPAWGLWLQMLGYGLMLASSLYVAAIYSFFALPIAISILKNIVYWPQAIVAMVATAPIMVIVFGYLSFPIGMAFVTLRDYKGMVQAFRSQVGKYGAWALGLAIPLLWAGSLAVLQHQPQIQALQWLNQPATTTAQRQELLDKSPQIREGLLNAYLSKYRYLSVQKEPGEYDQIAYLFQENFGLPKPISFDFQRAYNWLVSPFLYAGSFDDSNKASDHYARFFDQPILRAEPSAISAAVNATFDRNTAKAGLMDINQQKVLLGKQDLTITPHGDWADVAIHEVYQNQTTDQLEVLYYFTLPESTTITGLWLGESDDLSKRFQFTVSPRGAAQQVYTNQTVRRVDPALLEQVGPGNYRLRAFPVLPKGDKPMHLWLTYKAMQESGGNYPLPQLLEKRNIYWTNASQRNLNGKPVNGNVDSWFPTSSTAATKSAQTHVINFESGEQIVATPSNLPTAPLPQQQRFAVLLDSSLSMQSQQAKLAETIKWLQTKLAPQNQLDLYIASAEGVAPKFVSDFAQFDLKSVQFYGTLQPKQILAQFMKLRDKRPYDGILLVTDPGSYELTTDESFKASLPAPLWMVHLGDLAAAYDDDTQQAIQVSQGGVVTQVEDALQRLATNRKLGKDLVNVVDGYTWRRLPSAAPMPAPADPKANFAPIAARQLVQARSRDLKPNEVEELDLIHTIAKEQGIVTPYSSMIVLVNDQQRRELEEAENARDRFNREVEDQQLKAPGGVGEISGVPEPQEWLLLIAALAVGAAGWRWLRPAKLDPPGCAAPLTERGH